MVKGKVFIVDLRERHLEESGADRGSSRPNMTTLDLATGDAGRELGGGRARGEDRSSVGGREDQELK